MSARLTASEVLEQSRSALASWGPRWERNAEANGEIIKAGKALPHREMLMTQIGRRAVLCGMGASLEQGAPMLAKYPDAADVLCVDKAFGALVDAGVKVRAVCLADAMVNYEKYCEPWLQHTKDVLLIACVTANPKWARRWLGPKMFWVNKDNIGTEEKFSALSGCHEAFPASSNVGNSLVVGATQLLGYDRYILTGYDFCWSPWGNYYAWDYAWEKRCFMGHYFTCSGKGAIVQTSNNLRFSARWLSGFCAQVRRAGIDVVDTSRGLLDCRRSSLETQLKLAAREPQRKWTEQERDQFLASRRTSVKLAVGEFERIPDLLKNQTILTQNVQLWGVPRAALEYASAH